MSIQRKAPQKKQNALTKQERVYGTIRELILSGTYVPGQRLVIDAIAEEFEVSTLPVREAIWRLQAEGLIIYRPNVGAQVAPADPGVFEEEMTIFAVLEGYATAITAPLLGKAQVGLLRQINQSMVETMGRLDSLAFGRLNQEFHDVIYEHCPNAALVEMLRGVGRRLGAIRRTVFVQIPDRGAASVDEHLNLIELIVRRAPFEQIETVAREHKLSTLESFRSWQVEHRG